METGPVAEATKMVVSHFGEKAVTRAEFVKRWTDAFHDFYNLTATTEDFQAVDKMFADIGMMAGRRWDGMK